MSALPPESGHRNRHAYHLRRSNSGSFATLAASRSIIIHMRRRAPTEIISPYRRRRHEPEGNAPRDRLCLWAAAVTDSIKHRFDSDDMIDMPDGIADRDADVWEPMFLIADAAGDHWPDTARVTAVTHVMAYKDTGTTASWGLRLLSDLVRS